MYGDCGGVCKSGFLGDHCLERGSCYFVILLLINGFYVINIRGMSKFETKQNHTIDNSTDSPEYSISTEL